MTTTGAVEADVRAGARGLESGLEPGLDAPVITPLAGRRDDVRVLVVDQHPLARRAVRTLLDTVEGVTVVGELDNGQAAVLAARQGLADVVLMDVHVPVLDGIQATRQICRLPRPPKVIILSVSGDATELEAAVLAGASGYLLTETVRDLLSAAVCAAMAGQAVLAPAATAQLMTLYASSHRAVPSGHRVRLQRLTRREREVLDLVLQGHGNDAVASSLFLARSTVKSHIRSIYHKLGARDRVQLLMFAHEARLAVGSVDVVPAAASG